MEDPLNSLRRHVTTIIPTGTLKNIHHIIFHKCYIFLKGEGNQCVS